MFSRIALTEPMLLLAFTSVRARSFDRGLLRELDRTKGQNNAMAVKVINGLASLLCARGNRRKSVLFRAVGHMCVNAIANQIDRLTGIKSPMARS